MVLALLASPLAAQSADSAVGRDASGAALSLWHAAIEARSALSNSPPRDVDVLRAMDAELTLGYPDRVPLVLVRHGVTDPALESEKLAIEAAGAYASGAFARAGELYTAAAALATGTTRGIRAARAGDALARAGQSAAAVLQYRVASGELSAITGWLALREAQVTADTSGALGLLDHVPTAARPLVPRVRGESFALVGDTARAVVILAGAGFDGRAAALALASSDSTNARQLTYRALRSGDTTVTNAGIQLATGPLPPRTPDEFVLLGRAIRRQSPDRAAALLGEAVALGDGSAPTALLWGDVLAEAGNQVAALDAYTRAAAGTGPEAVQAEVSQGRTLIRLGRPVAAFRALTQFVSTHPDHNTTPMASFLVADLSHQAGRPDEADSLYRVVMDRWPGNEYASQARVRLAARALVRGDTVRATQLYRAEADMRGAQQFVARYLLGDLAFRASDTSSASTYWAALARADSLGYYGSLARARLGWASPTVPASPGRPPVGELAKELEQLDLLDQIGFAPEATTLVNWLVAGTGDTDGALDLAEALVARGRTTQAIGLGWRAARTRTLNDPRVLRAIYPWPMRGIVTAEAREFGIDPYLLAALVRQESSFDIGATSRAGARGLMQVMPGTARQAARQMGLEWSDHLLHVPDANLHVGAAHLAILLRHYQGDLGPSLAAYNAGMTPVELWRRFPEARDPALFVERIPYPETRGYVRAVLRNWTIYRALYP